MPLPTCKDCNAPAKLNCDCIEYTGEQPKPPQVCLLRQELQEANRKNVALMADLQDAKLEIRRLSGLISNESVIDELENPDSIPIYDWIKR